MALQGFDKNYFLPQALAKLQELTDYADQFRGQNVVYLEEVLAENNMTAEFLYENWGYKYDMAPNQFFDKEYYINALSKWAVANNYYATEAAAKDAVMEAWAGKDFYQHYVEYGSKSDINPSAAFDESSYLDNLYAWAQANAAGALTELGIDNVAELRTFFNDNGVTALGNYMDYGRLAGIAATPVHEDVPGTTSVITPGQSGSADIMGLTGDQAVRIDFTNPANQIKGLDLDGDGVIEANGVENAITGKAANFEIVDAYARNPLNEGDKVHNYLGNIAFDGTGFAGDGVNTDGNIFLGGLGADIALGGIGNDFMAGGGVASGRFVFENNAFGVPVLMDKLYNRPVQPGESMSDTLRGGRNADFFFVELSLLDPTDGKDSLIDGGSTTDDSAAGLNEADSGVNSQNNDWLLLEASDDDEPVIITLGDGGRINTDAGAEATLEEIESIDASGNLYGHVNDIEVELGARATDLRSTDAVAGTENYGIGSTAQLDITGSTGANVIIGGYDNDKINGAAGNDILFGGNLRYLLANRNNPNILNGSGGLDLNVTAVGTVNDGRDNIFGGTGDDNIVFEMDGGTVGGGDNHISISRDTAKTMGDTLWLTDFSMGRLQGATLAGEETAQQDALAKMTTDNVVRFDLGNDGAVNFQNYGGTTNVLNPSQDVTNYAASVNRVTVSGMESVIATGLGAIDFRAAGTNSPELNFSNQQNFKAINADLDLRGSSVDNTLYANTGKDVIEGRTGDDNLSGGQNDDVFVFEYGDGVDIVHRQLDANNDNLWDTDSLGRGILVQDFRAPQEGDISSSRLVIDFGATDLTSPNVKVGLFNLVIGGTTFSVSYDALMAAKSAVELAAVVDAAYKAIDPNVSVSALNNTIIVTDSEGREISDTVEEGYAVGVILGNSAAATAATFYPGGTPTDIVEDDIIIFKDYQNRDINLGENETIKEINNAVKLTARFDATGTQLAEGQKSLVKLVNVNEGDTVTITINGKNYSYTAKANEKSEKVAEELVKVINNELDLNSGSGKITANDGQEVKEFDDDDRNQTVDNSNLLNIAVLSIAQDFVGSLKNSLTYMNISVSVTNNLTGSAAGLATLHNQSSTHIDLVGFDGRDGNVNPEDVLFLGRGTETVSILQTAHDSGETIIGKDATFDLDSKPAPATGTDYYNWINGDDLLYGGNGNDVIKAGTGDDRIMMTKGNDTVEGGGNSVNPDGATHRYIDVLQAEESVFGGTTYFKVTLDGTLGATGKGVVTASDANKAEVGKTEFNDIEAVRILENNRSTTLDVQTLSDNVAAAVATDDDVAIGLEGVTIRLTRDNPDVTYSIDGDKSTGKNNGSTTDGLAAIPGKYDPVSGDYNEFKATSVYGAENIITGKANDTFIIDESQITADNRIEAGSQQDNNLYDIEGYDIVKYNHQKNSVVDPKTLPNMTVQVEAESNTDKVSMTGGILGNNVFADTLVDVEMIDVTEGAKYRTGDGLDLSKMNGATVAFGAGAVVQKSLGGASETPDTVAEVEADRLENGGVSVTGNGLGNEKVEIVGITELEIVTGSSGEDRIIIGDASNMNSKAVDTPANLILGRATHVANATTAAYENVGLYQFNLGAGNDSLDYFNANNDIAVSIDTSLDADGKIVGKHYALVDNTAGSGMNLSDEKDDRVDVATGVERFWASANPASTNAIDLTAATMNTTIEFSRESKLHENEVKDPNGDDGKNNVNIVRGTEVRSTDNSALVFGRFMDRTENYDKDYANPSGEAYWNTVYGSKTMAETVIMTDNESAKSSSMSRQHILNLGGGENVVDYSARTDSITAVVNNVDADKNTQSVNADGDEITVDYAIYDVLNPAASQKTLTVIASAQDNDTISVNPLVTNIDSYNLVDLQSGVVVVDVLDSVETDEQSKVINIKNFENIEGSDAIDRLYGDGSANRIEGEAGNDWIAGRGGRGQGFGDADHLVGGAGNDRFIYETESDSGTSRTNVAVADDQWDTIEDFNGNGRGDLLVFNTTDTGLVAEKATDSRLTFNVVAGESTVQIRLDQNADGAIDAVAVNNIKDQDYTVIDTNGGITVRDILFRVQQTSGQDIQNLDKVVYGSDGSSAGAQFEIVYTSASESNSLSAPDNFKGLNLNLSGGIGNGADKIDLRAFDFATFAGDQDPGPGNPAAPEDKNNNGISDLVEDIIYVNQVSDITEGVTKNFFREGAEESGIHRAVRVELRAEIAGGNNFRVFVDVDRDGDYTMATDLVFELTNVQDNGNALNTVAGSAFKASLYDDAAADGNGSGIFVFNDAQYQLWHKVDVTAPAIDLATGLYPADGAADVAVGDNIVMQFSENITIADSNGIMLVDDMGNVVPSSNYVSGWMGITSTLVIDPDADLAHNTHYHVLITPGAVTDVAGNAFAGLVTSDQFDFTTAAPPVTYVLTAEATSYDEGQIAVFNLATTNVADGTDVAYTITGVEAADIVDANLDGDGNALTGIVTVNANAAVINVELFADHETETDVTMTVALDNGEANALVTVVDTSTAVTETYALTAAAASYDEGQTAVFNLATTNVPDSATVAYTLSGVEVEDIVDADLDGDGNALTGIATVTGNAAVINVELAADHLTEGDVTMTVALDNGEATSSVTVVDASTAVLYTPVVVTGDVSGDNGIAEAFVIPVTVTGGVAYSNDITATITLGAEDIIRFDDSTVPPATEAEFIAANILITPDPFANSTVLAFQPTDGTHTGTQITLAGIQDVTLGNGAMFEVV